MDTKRLSVLVCSALKCMVLAVAIVCFASVVFAAEADYSGGMLERSTITGDWGGLRNDLAKKGIVFDANLVMIEQGVTGGGIKAEREIGGRGNLLMHVDTNKLGLWPGGFLTVEVEGNWGEGANLRNGGLMTVNTSQIFPVPGDDYIGIPALNLMQFLSEYYGVVIGKLDTTSGDMNEFAHGKGDTQFMNLALNINPTLLMTGPYSTLGTGVIVLPTKDPKAAIVTCSVISSTGKATTSGLGDLDSDALTFTGEARVRTDFFERTGHQLFGAMYSNKNFASIDQRLTLDPESYGIEMKSDSWVVYYNFDQYFYEPVKGSGKGVGVFGRFGVTDGDPNFINYFYSLGIGGKGVMDSRPNDRFGVGFYYVDIKSPSFTGPIATREILRDERGLEAYYSFALTPWAFLTPDIQIIRGAQEETVAALPANRQEIKTATVMGLRMRVIF